MSEDRDLQGGRQEMFHPRSLLGVPKCGMDAPGEGNRNKCIGYCSHQRDVLGTEADDRPWESGGGVRDLPPHAVFPSNVRDGPQARQVDSSHRQRAHHHSRDIVEELGPGVLCTVGRGEECRGRKSDMVERREGVINGVRRTDWGQSSAASG